VQTGIATAVIVRTGKDTAFGEIAQRLAMRPPETEFGRGIRHFGLMIQRGVDSCCWCCSSCWWNVLLHRPVLESFLFLDRAGRRDDAGDDAHDHHDHPRAGVRARMARKKVLVKQLTAIEDFGSIEILCSDKTGTLTEGEIVPGQARGRSPGQDNQDVLRFVYLNSYFQAGIKESIGRTPS